MYLLQNRRMPASQVSVFPSYLFNYNHEICAWCLPLFVTFSSVGVRVNAANGDLCIRYSSLHLVHVPALFYRYLKAVKSIQQGKSVFCVCRMLIFPLRISPRDFAHACFPEMYHILDTYAHNSTQSLLRRNFFFFF